MSQSNKKMLWVSINSIPNFMSNFGSDVFALIVRDFSVGRGELDEGTPLFWARESNLCSYLD